MNVKKCTCCEKEFPATTEYYFSQSKGKYGVEACCKQCRTKKRLINYKENKNEILATGKRWVENNKELVKEKSKKSYQKNKELIHQKYLDNKVNISVFNKQYREKNRDTLIEYAKNWKEKNKDNWMKYYSKNKDKVSIRSEKRRKSYTESQNPLTYEQWENCLIYFNNECAYCGSSCVLEKEHFIPLTKGGSYSKDNIIPVCKSCNSSKKDTDFNSWYPMQKNHREDLKIRIFDYLGSMDISNCNNRR